MACEHKNLPSHRYCVVCGEQLMRISCAKCGCISLATFNFCPECGNSLENHSMTNVKSDTAKKPITHAESNTKKIDLNVLLASVLSEQDGDIKLESGEKMSQSEIKKFLKQRKSINK